MQQLKVLMDDSTDLFGRVVVYKLDIYGAPVEDDADESDTVDDD